MLANCQGKNIDWNAQDDNGDTPLMIALKTAIRYMSEESVFGYYLEALEDLKNFLEAAETPFDMHLPNRHGLTAWDYVMSYYWRLEISLSIIETHSESKQLRN